jgi:undecaprenyl diphosphate synthase
LARSDDHLKIKPKGGLPRHIAIIMDGNGRWAKQRGLPRIIGHREGIKSVRTVVEACSELGVDVLTLYTFSTENWRRPKEEVSALMKLLLKTIQKEINDLIRNNVRLTVIGNLDLLPDAAKIGMLTAIEKTRSNTGLNLNLALSYGSREELVRAAKQIAVMAKSGELDPENISSDTIRKHLYTAEIPDPDLLIRTSGEFRISNFLLWQLAYTEIYVTDVLWPDFGKQDLQRAIADFQGRERRFGKVSEQLKR